MRISSQASVAALAALVSACLVSHSDAFSPSPAARSSLFRGINSRPRSKLAPSLLGELKVSAMDENQKEETTQTRPTSAQAAEGGKLSESSSSSINSDEFDWFKAWYPIVPVEFLSREKPQNFKLLNMDLVIWNDGHVEGSEFGSKKNRPKKAKRTDGEWRVFSDFCPHRKVPLSEGRVEDDGSILCSYHAWRWNGDGDLKAVPQAGTEDDFNKIKNNPKSSCNLFPTQVINGVLWVWPESGSDAAIESALTPANAMSLPQETDDSIEASRVIEGPWNFRELPYGHDYFIENALDPAHVPTSHHNVAGNRYEGNEALRMTTTEPLSKNGFMISFDSPEVPLTRTNKFVAPSLAELRSPTGEDGGELILELYSSPSRPGFCNHVGRQVIVKSNAGETPDFLKMFLLPVPKWVNHIMAGVFLNQDALFLHHQERALHNTGQYSTNLPEGSTADHYTKTILPMTADKGVINFRNWMRIKAGGRIPYRHNPAMPPTSNEVVFDIYNSHTKHCKNCMAALKNLRKARLASYLAAAIVAVFRPAKLGNVGVGALIALFGGLGLGMGKLIKLMYRMEYSHAEND